MFGIVGAKMFEKLLRKIPAPNPAPATKPQNAHLRRVWLRFPALDTELLAISESEAQYAAATCLRFCRRRICWLKDCFCVVCDCSDSGIFGGK